MKQIMNTKPVTSSPNVRSKIKINRQKSKPFIRKHKLYLLAVINFRETRLLFFYTRFPFELTAVLVKIDNPKEILWRSSRAIFKTDETIKPHNIFMVEEDICFQYWLENKVSVEVFSLAQILEQPLSNFTPAVFDRVNLNPILLPLSNSHWQSLAVFNCAALYLNGRVHFVYRAIGESGLSNFGYASSSDGVQIDKRSQLPIYQNSLLLEMSTSFSESEQPSNIFSHALNIEKAEIDHQPVSSQAASVNHQPVPSTHQYQSGINWGGYEDPRLTQVEDTIYMTYTAFDGINPPGVAITSISTRDFLNENWRWREPALISAPHQAHKNWVIFPEKINGKFAILHSLTPKVNIDYFDDLLFEDNQFINSIYQSSGRENHWDNWMRGVGPPPIKTKDGWLVFYHAMDRKDPDRYKVGAMLLDLKQPEKIIYRTNKPLLEPDARYENDGFKAGVVYACGSVVIGKIIYLYYGGADTVICAAFMKLDQLLEQLKNGRTAGLNKLLTAMQSKKQFTNQLTKRSTLCME